MQKTLIALGVLIVVVGIAWPWLSSTPLGRLPGDITIERENFRIYLPITTMIILSVALTLILWLFRR